MATNTFKTTSTAVATVTSSARQSGVVIPAAVATETSTELGNSASVASTSQETSPASSAPTTDRPDKPALSTAATAGIAVGGTVLLALVVGAAFFFMHRRKQNKSTKPSSPPIYEPTKAAYDKPELDGQALGHHYSELDVGTPVEYAELDAGTPAQSPAHLNADERNLNSAQNF